VQSSCEAVPSSPDLSTRFLLRSPRLLAKLGVSRLVRLSTPLPGSLECLSDPCEPSKPTSSRIRAHTFACSRSRNVYGCFTRSLRLSLAPAHARVWLHLAALPNTPTARVHLQRIVIEKVWPPRLRCRRLTATLLELLSLPTRPPGTRVLRLSPQPPRTRKISPTRLAVLPTQ
jgi:hypothetical protein